MLKYDQGQEIPRQLGAVFPRVLTHIGNLKQQQCFSSKNLNMLKKRYLVSFNLLYFLESYAVISHLKNMLISGEGTH